MRASFIHEGPTPFFLVFFLIVVLELISYPLNIVLPDPLFTSFEEITGSYYIHLAYLVSILSFAVLLGAYRMLSCKQWARDFQYRPARGFGDNHLKALWAIAASATVVLCYVAYVRMGGTIPLLVAGGISEADYGVLRFDTASAVGTEIIVLCQYISLPISALVAFSTPAGRWPQKLCTIALFGLVSLFTLERSTMVIPLLVFLAARISFKPLQWKFLLWPLAAGAAFICFMISLSSFETTEVYGTISALILGRVVHGQWLGLPVYLWYFDYKPAELGAILHPYLKAILGLEDTLTPGTELMMAVYPKASTETIGNIPTLFIGEAYAIGGWILVVISIVHVALLLAAVAYIFKRLPKTPITCLLYGIIIVKLGMGMVLGYSMFLFSMPSLLILLLFIYVVVKPATVR